MRTICFRCETLLSEEPQDPSPSDSHGICPACVAAWMDEAGICPPDPVTPEASAGCRTRCPIGLRCGRLRTFARTSRGALG